MSGEPTGVEIRANTVLPARRTDIELRTEDGLTLVGELAEPADGPARATLVTLHPLPTHGGFMDSHVLRKASFRLPALAGISVLRFNTRGTVSARGRSQGNFDNGRAERYDVLAAVQAGSAGAGGPMWLLGWSFGTDLALMYGCLPEVAGAILLSPPLRSSGPEHLQVWAQSGKPVLALVPEYDDYLRPEQARQRFAAIPQAEVVGVDGAKHLWVGESYVRKALDAVVARVAPDVRLPLPTSWDGPAWQAAPPEVVA